ncbi:MAG: polysaccharide deacetylase family protein [Bacteroidota bacterium]|nr:polysaccharide deacetylase family protein [Bacteroidota bacterium]
MALLIRFFCEYLRSIAFYSVLLLNTMNILTFDIEDWFHILGHPINNDLGRWKAQPSNLEKNLDKILEILLKHKQKATFFSLGWIAEQYPGSIRSISEAGFEIGSHTYSHRRIREFTPEVFREDVERSMQTVEDVLGKKVKSFRFPGFQVNNRYLWALEILAELGLEFDSSVQISHMNTRIPQKSYPVYLEVNGHRLKEFPIPVRYLANQVIYRSGSGFFRLYPYESTQRFLQKNSYNLVYFHPRDFDIQMMDKSHFNPLRNFKIRAGLSGALVKFERLLEEFEFMDIQTANKLVDWDESRVFRHSW